MQCAPCALHYPNNNKVASDSSNGTGVHLSTIGQLIFSPSTVAYRPQAVPIIRRTLSRLPSGYVCINSIKYCYFI